LTPSEKYSLRLYVTGLTPRSTRAITIVRAICEEHLSGNYELEIIDVYQMPHRISQDNVVAIPTLVKTRPEPMRLMIGDMTDRRRLLDGLGLPNDD
jgi:circadian clock protein KaiB